MGPFGFAQGRLFVGSRSLHERLRCLRMTNRVSGFAGLLRFPGKLFGELEGVPGVLVRLLA
jgi:hypothetical protein